MSRYIKQEDVLDRIAGAYSKHGAVVPMWLHIGDLPSADVEPVVRCKDCMHNGTYDTDCPMRGWFINDDDYCSRAEKMDGDKE